MLKIIWSLLKQVSTKKKVKRENLSSEDTSKSEGSPYVEEPFQL